MTLLLPKDFVDDKEAIKENLTKAIEEIVLKNQRKDGRYFILFHSRFDAVNRMNLRQKIKIYDDLPGFITNSIVFWVDNRRGLCEWLWTVRPDRQVEFNQKGVAYLQAKGAMPTKAD